MAWLKYLLLNSVILHAVNIHRCSQLVKIINISVQESNNPKQDSTDVIAYCADKLNTMVKDVEDECMHVCIHYLKSVINIKLFTRAKVKTKIQFKFIYRTRQPTHHPTSPSHT